MITWIIILTILAGLLLTVCGVGSKNEYYGDGFKRTRNYGVMIIAVVCILMIAFGSVAIIDATEAGSVKNTFTGERTTLPVGFNIINPFASKVTKYDMKTQVIELTFASYTKDAQVVDVIAEVQYELPRDRIDEIAIDYGSYDNLKSKINNVIEERIKVVLSRKSAMTLMETRAELSPEAATEIAEITETFPIVFRSVIVKDVSFSDAFEASVEQKMTAEQDALRAEQEKRRAII